MFLPTIILFICAVLLRSDEPNTDIVNGIGFC